MVLPKPIVTVEENVELTSKSSELAAVAVLPSGVAVVLVTLLMTTPDELAVAVVLPVVLDGVMSVFLAQDASSTVASRKSGTHCRWRQAIVTKEIMRNGIGCVGLYVSRSGSVAGHCYFFKRVLMGAGKSL